VNPTPAAAQPIQPVQPIQPIQPIQPVQPVQPIQPIQPVQPVNTTPALSTPEVGNPLAGAQTAADAEAALLAVNRPSFRVQQGQYFRWSAPDGWKSNETTNGVDIASPDGHLMATSCLVPGATGQSTPRAFVETFLPKAGAQNLNIVQIQDLPDQNINGMPTKISQMEITYTDSAGAQYHGLCTCAIAQDQNAYNAFLQGSGAAAAQWDQVKTWLPAVAGSVQITNPAQVAMRDRLVMPTNRPLYDQSVMAAWNKRAAAQANNGRRFEETTLGYQRMKDPATGQMYDMPFEAYNQARGGYVNPANPSQLLVQAGPNE
jgi:hypothetical protein